MASPAQWTWVWVSSRGWWWTGKPGVLQPMGLQRVGREWATELNADNGALLHKFSSMHCCTQCLHRCHRPPLTHASARASGTLMGKPGSVSCGVTTPFSWVLVHTRFYLCPQRVCFPSCVSFGGSVVGLMATSSRRAYATPRSHAPRVPA